MQFGLLIYESPEGFAIRNNDGTDSYTGAWRAYYRTFPDSPLRGTYANNRVYEGMTGWDAFEPALSRAEEMDAHGIWRCASDIPEEWCEGDRVGLERLVDTLYHRRPTIRELIGTFRRSSRNPLPNWRESPHSVTSLRRDHLKSSICNSRRRT